VVLPLLPAVVGVAITGLLAAGAVWAGALTRTAGVIAAAFGVVVVVIGGFAFLALLVLFVVASVLATRYGFEEKRRRNVHEGQHGERGVSNVVAHIVAPTALVLTAWLSPSVLPVRSSTVLYTAALAFGAADTFASEFGVLAGDARSILTLRSVPAGTNGGVSALGEAWAFVGAVSTAGIGTGLFYVFRTPSVAPVVILGVAAAAGFIGCQLDSVLGETLENRGILTKGSTNFFAMALSILAALGLLVALGGPA
jgi:uncharacterized protein (TIGR00297 family)